MSQSGTTFKGVLLVTGTTIGGGMLALPVATAFAGFIPSILLFFFCWAFMAATGLLFLELCFWFKKGVNIITMARNCLGTGGALFAWALYLFLFYCLTVAYIAGCADLINDLLGIVGSFHPLYGQLIFVVLAFPLIYVGPSFVGRFNIPCMFFLFFFFVLFLVFGFSYVNSTLLLRQDWGKIFFALPVAFATFAYQGLVPTLAYYLDYDKKACRIAIVLGSFIPFLIYILWIGLISGIVPVDGEGGLIEALHLGKNAIYPLKSHTEIPGVYFIGQCFAFFALITSFFGVTLGLRDFLADGLKIPKNSSGKFVITTMILVPPLLVTLYNPGLFLQALDLAGGFGVSMLLGLLPIAMVWQGRYKKQFSGEYRVFGGKVLLLLLLLFVLFEIVIETKQTFFNF